MESYDILSTPLSVYVITRWLVTLFVALVFAGLYCYRRHLFIKPSIQLVLLHHLLFQWPAATFAGYIEKYLRHPWILSYVLDGYILGCLAGSLWWGNRMAAKLNRRLKGWGYLGPAGWPSARVIITITFTIALSLAIYLAFVPVDRTGLYSLIVEPARSREVREESLKLLDNAFVVYVFTLMRSSVAPIAVVLVMEGLMKGLRRNVLASIVGVLGVVAVCVGVLLPGDRYALVRLVLGVLLWDWLRQGMRFRVRQGVLCLIALAPAVVQTMLREGESWQTWREYFGLILVHRVWVSPLEVGVWYLDYADRLGTVGVAAFPKLAYLLGVTPVDVSNVVGLAYVENAMASISAGAGFVFSYYAYIGFAAMPLCVVLTVALDGILGIYSILNRRMLLPAVVVVMLALVSMVQGEYTVALISHGLIPGLLMVMLLSKIDRKSADQAVAVGVDWRVSRRD
jgi:hypothetical protein